MMALNFGDSSLHAVGSQPLVWLWANGLRKPRYLWYLVQTADSGYKEAIRRNSPFGLVFFPDGTGACHGTHPPGSAGNVGLFEYGLGHDARFMEKRCNASRCEIGLHLEPLAR